MVLSMTMVALENAVTPESLLLYLAALCVFMAMVLVVGIAFRHRA